MSDYGINISAPNINVNTANNSQLLLTSKYPFDKLDTQTNTSFQTIFLLFNTDTPEPDTGTTNTTVYSFAHGYIYVPKVWALFQTVANAPLTNFYQAYFQDTGIIATKTVHDQATMFIAADSTNVNIVVSKYNDGSGSSNLIKGASFNITIFTFVDDFNV